MGVSADGFNDSIADGMAWDGMAWDGGNPAL